MPDSHASSVERVGRICSKEPAADYLKIYSYPDQTMRVEHCRFPISEEIGCQDVRKDRFVPDHPAIPTETTAWTDLEQTLSRNGVLQTNQIRLYRLIYEIAKSPANARETLALAMVRKALSLPEGSCLEVGRPIAAIAKDLGSRLGRLPRHQSQPARRAFLSEVRAAERVTKSVPPDGANLQGELIYTRVKGGFYIQKSILSGSGE
jgi:hypothetical protein